MLMNLSRVSLLGLAIFGGYCIHVFAKLNGFSDTVKAYSKQGVLSDNTPYNPVFTGKDKVDEVLNLLVQFFWTAVNGKHLDLVIFSAYFATQCIPAYNLMIIEGLRHTGSNHVLSFTTVFGMLVQILGFAFAGPLYLFIQLMTTSNTLDATARKTLAIPESQLWGLSSGLIWGFIIPTIVLGLPSPGLLSTNQKITAILTWQAFPVLVMLSQKTIAQRLRPRDRPVNPSDPASLTPSVHALRGVYRNSLWMSGMGNLIMVNLMLGAILRPEAWGSTKSMLLLPAHILTPPNPFSGTKIADMHDGALWLLQWDYTITIAAYMIWAFCCKYTVVKTVSLIGLVKDLIIKPIFYGPSAAALLMIWERDELALSQYKHTSEKARQ